MNEIWKDIPGYEGLYQVSNFGNVMSLNYKNYGYQKVLTPKCNNKGRLWVELIRDGKRKPLLIHRLVGLTFIPNPQKYPQINHKDENPKNNHVGNLEWCTGEYNRKYYYERHPEFKKTGERRGKLFTLHIVQKTLDGDFVKLWDNSCQIKKELGFSDWSISECCRGRRNQAYGFIWQYAD